MFCENYVSATTAQQIIQSSILMKVMDSVFPKDSDKVSNRSESYKSAEFLTFLDLVKNGRKFGPNL